MSLHLTAKEYSQRPSSFLGLSPASWEAYQFDLVVRATGVQWENEQYEKMQEEGGTRPQGNKSFKADSKPVAKPNADWGELKGLPGVTFK